MRRRRRPAAERAFAGGDRQLAGRSRGANPSNTLPVVSGSDVVTILLVILCLIGAVTALGWLAVGVAAIRERRSARSSPPGSKPSGDGPRVSQAEDRVLPAVGALEKEFGDSWPDAETLERNAHFVRAVQALRDEDGETLFVLAKRTRRFLSYVALAALGEADDAPDRFTDWAFRSLRETDGVQDVFIFRALTRHAHRPVIADALAKVDEGVNHELLARFIGERRLAGETFDEEVLRKNVSVRLAEEIEPLIDSYEELLGPDFRSIFDSWRTASVDLEFLGSYGRVWSRPYDEPPALLIGRRQEIVGLLEEELGQQPRRSVLLVGEHGVGKTALVRAALHRVGPELIVFEASAAQLNAGATYVGELEGRVKELVERAREKPLVWHLPNLEEALYAGQHSRSPQGLLDALLPAIAAGELTIVAEAAPSAAERLLSERPQIMTAFQVVQVRPLEQGDAIAVARHAIGEDSGVGTSDETLRDAFELAQQFLPRIASPGNLLRLVRAAKDDAEERGGAQIGYSELIDALAASTGLPLTMLDASVPLQLDDVHRYFQERVLGQEEAVECLVQRVAMIKAGLTDPTRPFGVFLFVGPTGTGKTEIAKALAEFLFGSSDRLVRLDMSEFRTPEAHERLLADTSTDSYGSPLIAAIRKEPFAVVLLDEFEKAADPIWDLFLQVFDDGRLTDQHGRTVDLRRCVIILTSNIGSSIASRPGLGFARSSDPFRPETVIRALEQSFRPEFLNRIDSVVVFRPFERAQMRALLDKELADALARRGLRERPWAVELDDSAYEFLIEQGFSPSLGARPLKRAVERHLLAPLAAAIVEQRAPSGDQFLLVSAPGGERITVTFVDPDAEEAAEVEREPDLTTPHELDVRSLALSPRADSKAAQFLLEELRRVGDAVRNGGLARRKDDHLAAMTEPGFWEDEGRFAALGEVEYLDRLEAALETADRLGERLSRHRGRDGAARLGELVAARLYVLDRALAGLDAGAPTDVYVRIRPGGEAAGTDGAAFAALLTAMYDGWAGKRGMRLDVLSEADGVHVLSVAGLGCGAILLPEAGLHVLELVRERRDGEREIERVSATVDVAAAPVGRPDETAAPLDRARQALESTPTSARVVRRYRRDQDPLVRDAVRGYRTGRVDRVLAGDFDLF